MRVQRSVTRIPADWQNEPMVFRNVNIILPDRILRGYQLRTADGRIAAIEPEDMTDDCIAIDGAGLYLAPGFVDQHTHAGGVWYVDDPAAAVRHNLRHGTTSQAPTCLLKATIDEIYADLTAIADYADSDDPLAAAIVAIHMECPYMNSKYGAHREWSRQPNVDEALLLQERGRGLIKLWTIAPELDGIVEVCRALRLAAPDDPPVFLVGHSEASAEEIYALLPYGLRGATHCTNATGTRISPTRFGGTREFSVDDAVFLNDDIYAEVIPDVGGYHVRPLMLQLILKVKGVNRVIIVTDSTASDGPPPENLRGQVLDVNFTANSGLSGSLLTMDRSAANMRRHTGASLIDIFRMAALNPATLLGIDFTVGSIAVGKAANLILVDENIDLHRVWLHGRDVTDIE
ncbi:MAG: amidohydrolase family protein [Clostridiaceae bacterium]|nr:amidohydrolase family protein [Clostridiaceae bacterium]